MRVRAPVYEILEREDHFIVCRIYRSRIEAERAVKSCERADRAAATRLGVELKQ
jgi:hypothetical protein